MVKKLFFSDQLDVLVDFLLQETESDAPLHPRTLLVPHPELKNWLMLKIAEKKGIAAGYQIFTVDELLCRTMPHRIVLFAQLYQALEKSQNTEIQSYLQCKAKKITELADTLTALFYSYGKEGLELQSEGWQEELYRQLFLRQPLQLSAPLHCFACHFLSEKTWHEILQVESVSLYLFSPCQHFWEDLSTHWEKKKLLQCANPLSRRQLQSYLEEAPPLLANWGKMGRETLKILDAYDFHIEESYTEEKGDSALSQLRRNLLTFERTPIAQDRSIAIFQTGSSPWREIEILKENIEHLAKQGTPFSDMVVLAPDIDSYVPFIEFVFSDAIPYRILDVEIGQRSHFLQGLYRLLAFQPEKALLLFETSSFYRKRNWDISDLTMIRTWFEAGFDKTLDALLVSSELQVEWSDADLLEEVLFLWTSLQNELKVAEKTTLEWAQFLEPLIDTYLWVDETDDADAAAQQMVQRFLKELRLVECDWKFPLPILQHLLEKRSCRGSIHPSHLHAVKFGSLQCGCITPSRALFLIGMDEESFPRRIEASSLSLMPRKEEDRYLMLQALFAAREHWIFSYGHLSSEDGKSVEPSLALQELFSEVGGSYSVTAPPIRTFPQRKYLEDFFGLEKPWPELPQGEVTVHLTDLSRFARHPWDYYLQKELGIFLKKEPLDSFAAQRTQLAKESLQESLGKVLDRHELPPGLIGKAQQEELQKLSAKWEEQLREWHVTAATWSLLKTCRFVKKVSSHHVESPPLRISLTPELTVHIVGQLKNMSETGLISTSDDLLKIWPEALTGALLSAHPQIYLLKSLKMASIQQPEEAMRAFLLYYFRCQARASPLISPWADFFLKEGKIKKGYFEDPVADWVLSRIAMPPEDKLLEKWGWLKETFQYAKI